MGRVQETSNCDKQVYNTPVRGGVLLNICTHLSVHEYYIHGMYKWIFSVSVSDVYLYSTFKLYCVKMYGLCQVDAINFRATSIDMCVSMVYDRQYTPCLRTSIGIRCALRRGRKHEHANHLTTRKQFGMIQHSCCANTRWPSNRYILTTGREYTVDCYEHVEFAFAPGEQ